MTALPIPKPRTSGGRPPIDPPTRTTFDSSSGDSEEEMHRVFADSVKHLLKHAENSTPERLPLYLTLIQMRRKAIEKELRFERLLAPDTLPPLLRDFYSLEGLFEEDEAIRTYKSLLETLQIAEQSVLAKMRDQNVELPASEL